MTYRIEWDMPWGETEYRAFCDGVPIAPPTTWFFIAKRQARKHSKGWRWTAKPEAWVSSDGRSWAAEGEQ